MSDSNQVPQQLWHFACEFYARSELARICLELQERAGANVNVILSLCWLEIKGRALSEAGFAALLASCQSSEQNYLLRIRKLRQALAKEAALIAMAPALKAAVKKHLLAAELELEKNHLQQIEALLVGESSNNTFLKTPIDANQQALDLVFDLNYYLRNLLNLDNKFLQSAEATMQAELQAYRKTL